MSGTSIYLFDFDDNIMRLDTPVILLNTATREEKEVSTGAFASMHRELGRPGPWQDYRTFKETFRHFRDAGSEDAAIEQRFVSDVKAAIASNSDWQGPAWDVFRYACDRQRPVGIVTARGHEPETITAGIQVLVDRGLLPAAPNYLSVVPVSNVAVRKSLGDPALDATIPVLKKRAILSIVDTAESTYGDLGLNQASAKRS